MEMEEVISKKHEELKKISNGREEYKNVLFFLYLFQKVLRNRFIYSKLLSIEIALFQSGEIAPKLLLIIKSYK